MSNQSAIIFDKMKSNTPLSKSDLGEDFNLYQNVLNVKKVNDSYTDKIFELIREIVAIRKSENTEEFKKYDLQKVFQRVGELSDHLMIKSFLKMDLALLTSNNGLVRDRMRYLFSIHPEYFLFHKFRPNNEQVKFIIQYVTDLVFRIEERLPNKKLISLFKTYLKNNFSGTDKIVIDWSLNEVRELTTSPNWGLTKPLIWLRELDGRTSALELDTYILKMFDYKYFSKEISSHMWIFSFVIPKSKELREEILTTYDAYQNSQNLFEKYLFLQAIKNKDFKNLWVRSGRKIERPIFSYEREFYINLLETGIAVDLAIIELIRLGDYRKEYIWWPI